jgi:hypothetical protein
MKDCEICYETKPDWISCDHCIHYWCLSCESSIQDKLCPFCRKELSWKQNLQINDTKDNSEIEQNNIENLEYYLESLFNHIRGSGLISHIRNRRLRDIDNLSFTLNIDTPIQIKLDLSINFRPT